MTFPNPLRAAAVQEPDEEMQWTPEQHQNGFKQQQYHDSDATGDQLDFARFGAQFDFSPVYPRSFQVPEGRRDLPFQLVGDRRDLSTQTAPPFRAEQRHVDDFRAYHTESFAHQGHQNHTEQHGMVEGVGSGVGGMDTLGQPDFRGKTIGMDAGSPYDFTVHDDMNGFNAVTKGAFRDYLPMPVQTPGTFKVNPVETINPAHLEQVPTLDPSWTLSSTDLRMPSKQDLVMRPRSKKRRRALREEEPHSTLINQQRREAVVNASGGAVVSAEAEELFEVWLSKFKSIYPGEQHFQALTALTEINIETVRLWFAQKWQRGMQTSITPTKTEAESPVTITGLSIAPPQPAVAQAPHISLIGIRLEASTWVRNERGTKCTVVVNIAQLIRDSGKPYQCTMKCPKKFKDKDDWRKHEELNYPQEGWICDLETMVIVDGHSICSFCGMMDPPQDHVTRNHGKAMACHEKAMTDRGRLHHRKQHFRQHFCNIHPNIPSSQYLDSSYFTVDSTFPRRCGFCVYKPTTWKDRIEHIGGHFIDGQDMTTWRDEDVEDEKVDDNENDRDADHDHDGGSDDKDEFFSDEGSDSSDDDSDDAPRPSVTRQQDYRNTTSRYPQQGYNFTMPPSAGSPFLGGLRDLFRADSGVSLGGTTASRRVSITPHAETPYTRVKLLGVGPYSVVDEVQDVRTGVILARKTVHSSNKVDSRSLKNEVDIMKRLRHPHIVQFLGTYEVGSSISILMNPAADYDLAYFMEKHAGESGPGAEVVIQWFSCLVSSVRYIHEQSVRHQDIKPSNILIKNGIIMLADFGIAKTFSDSESTSSTAGAMTKKYCAPETSRLQPRGRSADIFSLGCVLLEMFSFLIYDGQPTFKGFQTSHFSGDLAYHENIPQLKNWIEILKNHRSIRSTSFEHYLLAWNVDEALTPDLSKIVNTIQPMLDDEPWNRPTALELSARFPPKLCCLSPVENPSEEVSLESQTSATLPIKKAYDMHATNGNHPPPRTRVSLFNNRPMSPTASLDSSLVSSRRESHFDFLAASFISTPRTSVGSISHYGAAISAKVEDSVVELSKDADDQLSEDDDVSEYDHDFDSTPPSIYGSPNSIYDDVWEDENLVSETRDSLRHKSPYEEIYEFENPPPIACEALIIENEVFEAVPKDSAGLPDRIDSPRTSLTLLHDPALTSWNTFNSRLKTFTLMIIVLLGAFVAQVLDLLYVKHHEIGYLPMFCVVAASSIIIIAPIRYLNAKTTTSHGVFRSITSWQVIMFCLVHLLANPIDSLWSLIQNKTDLNRRRRPIWKEFVISSSLFNVANTHLGVLTVPFYVLDRVLFHLGLRIKSSMPNNRIKARAGVRSRTTQIFLLSFVTLSFFGLWIVNITRRTTAISSVSTSGDCTTASPTGWDCSEGRCLSRCGQFKPFQSCKVDTVEKVVYDYQIFKVSPMDLESIYKITLGASATRSINQVAFSTGQTIVPACTSQYVVEASPTAGGKQRETITTTEAGPANPHIGKIPLPNQHVTQSFTTSSSPQESISSSEGFWNLPADIALNSEEDIGITLASETIVEEPDWGNRELKLPHLTVYVYASLFKTINATHSNNFTTVGWNKGPIERRNLQVVSTIITCACLLLQLILATALSVRACYNGRWRSRICKRIERSEDASATAEQPALFSDDSGSFKSKSAKLNIAHQLLHT